MLFPHRLASVLLLLSLTWTGLSPAATPPYSASFATTLERLLTTENSVDRAPLRFTHATPVLRELYKRNGYAPLWTRQGVLTPQASQLLGLLQNAQAFGLRASDYASDLIAERARLLTDAATSTDAAAQIDLDLSAAIAHFIEHLHYGRIDPQRAGFRLDTRRDAQRADLDTAATLMILAASSDIATDIKKVEPQFIHYELLKQALTRYRLLAADAMLTSLPPLSQRTLQAGDQYAGAAALRTLLVAEGDLAKNQVAPASDTTLDPALIAALQRYQSRHGLQPDGALGNKTFVALTTPMANRVRQIELTLERWRWLPALQTPPIVVNIPEFRLFAFHTLSDREADMLRMDVIVGRTSAPTRTPVFIGQLKYVVFRPYWDVPRSIVSKELLTPILANPNYLERNHFELVRGDRDDSPVVPATPENLAALRTGSVRLRQQPGADNPLGAIKFLFPNDYNVYLHGTSAPRYFNAAQRTFSHGCIRVSDPVALAEYVLRNAAEPWSREAIEAAMNDKPNQRITLRTPIPVMILYGTAMANEAGQVLLFDDIYGYDRKLEKLLGLSPPATPT